MYNFCFVDVETTGFSYTQHKILEVGILRVEQNKIVEEYSCLVNPAQSIPPFISQMTGINHADVAGQPTFDDIASDVAALLQNSVFVAHNVEFDWAFISNELQDAGESIFLPKLCTVELSRALYPTFISHSLESLIKRLELKATNQHRALNDAYAMWEFWCRAMQDHPQDFARHMQRLLKNKSALKKSTPPVSEKTPSDIRLDL